MTIRLVVLVLAALYSNGTIAGQITGQITGIVIYPGAPNFHFLVSGSYTSKPSCAFHTYMAIDMNQPYAKATIDAVMLAYASGKRVQAIGTGTCPAWQNNVEQLAHFRTESAL